MSQIRLDAGHIPIENGTGAEEISTEASISQLYGKSRILCLMVEVEELPLESTSQGVHLDWLGQAGFALRGSGRLVLIHTSPTP